MREVLDIGIFHIGGGIRYFSGSGAVVGVSETVVGVGVEVDEGASVVAVVAVVEVALGADVAESPQAAIMANKAIPKIRRTDRLFKFPPLELIAGRET